MDFNQMQDAIKSAFCSLVRFKAHGEKVLEIITPFHTVNSKAVSVFLTTQGEKLVATDGGWLAEADKEYGTPNSLDTITAEATRFVEMLSESFSIKKTAGAELHYYRATLHMQEVPAMVYDLANFLMGAINILCFEGEKGPGNRMLFQRDAKDFIKERFGAAASFNANPLPMSNIEFDATVLRGNQLSLIDYVTGNTKSHFIGDASAATVAFEIVSKYRPENMVFKRLILFNDEAGGYQPEAVAPYMQFLAEQTSVPPISWSRKEDLIEAIEANATS